MNKTSNLALLLGLLAGPSFVSAEIYSNLAALHWAPNTNQGNVTSDFSINLHYDPQDLISGDGAYFDINNNSFTHVTGTIAYSYYFYEAGQGQSLDSNFFQTASPIATNDNWNNIPTVNFTPDTPFYLAYTYESSFGSGAFSQTGWLELNYEQSEMKLLQAQTATSGEILSVGAAVPEPSAYATIVGLTGLALAGIRRRR